MAQGLHPCMETILKSPFHGMAWASSCSSRKQGLAHTWWLKSEKQYLSGFQREQNCTAKSKTSLFPRGSRGTNDISGQHYKRSQHHTHHTCSPRFNRQPTLKICKHLGICLHEYRTLNCRQPVFSKQKWPNTARCGAHQHDTILYTFDRRHPRNGFSLYGHSMNIEFTLPHCYSAAALLEWKCLHSRALLPRSDA